MCMIDGGGERCEVWREKMVQARKPHRCAECGREIEPGETYRNIFTVFMGDAGTPHQCRHCAVLADWLSGECHGYLTEGVVEDFEEHARDYHRFDLLRLLWGAHHQWRRKGVLLKVPTVPPTSEELAAA